MAEIRYWATVEGTSKKEMPGHQTWTRAVTAFRPTPDALTTDTWGAERFVDFGFAVKGTLNTKTPIIWWGEGETCAPDGASLYVAVQITVTWDIQDTVQTITRLGIVMGRRLDGDSHAAILRAVRTAQREHKTNQCQITFDLTWCRRTTQVAA